MSDSEDLDQRIQGDYGEGGEFGAWGKTYKALNYLEAVIIGGILRDNKLVEPKSGQKVLLFSPTANTGNVERALQGRLGDSVTVIAGDIVANPPSQEIGFIRLKC